MLKCTPDEGILRVAVAMHKASPIRPFVILLAAVLGGVVAQRPAFSQTACSPTQAGMVIRTRSMYAAPQTTFPGGPVQFFIEPIDAKWPVIVKWNFDDTLSKESVSRTHVSTISTVHVFATSGTYIVSCSLLDAKNTSVTTSVPVYVGTSDCP